MSSQNPDFRGAIRAATTADEPGVVAGLLQRHAMDAEMRARVLTRAIDLVQRCRGKSDRSGTLDAFLQEFGLSNKEGIALMCLAEALLRVPDEETADRLIAEKIRSGDWGSHQGRSQSRFVNASVWGLMLTGRIVRLDDPIVHDTGSWVRRLSTTLGEPVVRRATLQAMRIMGGQYVLGRTISEALTRGTTEAPRGTRFSFDMLGEGARTASDASNYFDSYADAIRSIGVTVKARDVYAANGISVKLSALHPRYQYRQHDRVIGELLPRVRELALMAKQARIGLSIDAEECDRLDISLDVFEALARDTALAGWNGLGFVLQAYHKRALPVVQWLADLARDSDRRLMVRLVKGAYWDSEIKHAQELGLNDYPVFTRKCHTDLSYQVCAEALLEAGDAIYPQFATHNAHTIAFIQAVAGERRDYEFQRLHGMGELLYEEVLREAPETPVRVYAPVGNHRDLLPYLVRRLLENGANSSFVNRFLDSDTPPEVLLRDPVEQSAESEARRHPQIPPPPSLYRDATPPWRNAAGMDLSDPVHADRLRRDLQQFANAQWQAAPLVAGQWLEGEAQPVRNPAQRDEIVGTVVAASDAAIDSALSAAASAQAAWDAAGIEQRAGCLERLAELMETHCHELMALLSREAGRTLDDGLSEVREAIDFCRYYAQQARLRLAPQVLPGPTGEVNELTLHGRGVFVCISPWNFPLAIFTGQVVAALVAGNSVIAKPAEQTPLIAARAVSLMREAGVPDDVLQLLPGDGARVGAALVADNRVAGVAFTGSTQTAKLINRTLADRDGALPVLIAETGGLNCMLVDATALPEQVVDDVVISAFQSAGQRCSALRVMYLQDDIADKVLGMLGGAMKELRIGDPARLETDIGPVIDTEAQAMLERHVERMEREATPIASCELGSEALAGTFFAPRVYGIERLDQLESEVFGPILHVIRYRASELSAVLESINRSGYGLTLGVHSRIDGFARDVFKATRVGNTYINRNMVGAIVGVNPFGGQGLSGTGPKAGGPHYLLRFVTEKTRTDNVTAKGGNAQLFNLAE
ncbi:bifunctional proline dehydrogenase/L-glutamate gamma-semialdehyde dehydrogenase PutA [Chromatocurvus halotolerans]|uniref:Bifunctional protein PutA n=1 Tax=Chromatocurvus halotolerans TaxID=1132028 RepID=A0A4R2L2Y3_9GAMM|nr:bifunctional proline dehydrogenase/L-glutamate gamma-semialdehyde dehydrogenase PutA [Chromatocurvus halotolerans]TCO78269.1 L-proline dehydrogenase /delta-1-pyrroline-5-carboxylate dehydrogenase [Chromatocurvus halotolerans]